MKVTIEFDNEDQTEIKAYMFAYEAWRAIQGIESAIERHRKTSTEDGDNESILDEVLDYVSYAQRMLD